MAIVNKIRERSGIAVAVIAVALLLFIVGGDIFSGRSSLFGDSNKVGEIAGHQIDAQQFAGLVDAQKTQYEMSTGRSANEQELAQIREQVWEKLIFENAYLGEFEKLGLTVTNEELRELIQGTKNMHPYVRQFFSDQSGAFNEAQHKEFINAAANNTLQEGQKSVWENFKKELLQVRLREKYQNLINATTYVTALEAKNEYVAQNEKADAKYLYVPFYSIQDTTVKVSDSQISDYYSAHKDEYQGYDSRSIEYVTFQVVPTKEDSAALNDEIRNLAKGLAAAQDPQAYANQNSDIRTPYLKSYSELSDVVKQSISTAIQGAIIGPFKEGNVYTIHKYEGTSTDSLYTVRASHILFRADKAAPDSVKAKAKESALAVLKQVKEGGDFATLARQYGQDGSAQQGGDLGPFQNNGQMDKTFQDATFAFSGTGVLPNLVETDFGFHIIKVTEPKSNLKYKLATVSKELSVGEASSTEVYQKADNLRASVKNLKEFTEAVKKDNSLALLTAERIAPQATSINTIQNAREIVRWAFDKNTEVGDVSETVFTIGDTYVIAAVKAASDKEDPKAEDFKDQITYKVRNDLKAEKILAKLGDGKGDLTAVANKYGAGALVEEVADINFFSGMLNSAGIDPIALGVVFGQKAGKRSKPLKGESGVFIIETLKKTAAPQIADYSIYKDQVLQRVGGGQAGFIAEQILRDKANIEDNRAKLF